MSIKYIEMKISIKSILPGLVLLLGCSFGCADLDESPDGLLTPANFYTKNEDLKAGTVAAYRPFMEFWLNSQGSLPTLAGDDVTGREGGNKEPFRGFDRFVASPAYEWLKAFSWDPLFRTVFHTNAVINNYENVPASEERDQIAAEAFFLRGWAYFRLARTFGDVPLILADATGEEPRTPVAEVYDQIFADLEFAAATLPASWPGEPGRVSKWAAKSLLAKAYLTSAGWPLKRTENYAKAADVAREVLDDNTHALMPEYRELWNAMNDNNPESVLAVQACETCGDWGLSNRMPFSIGPEAEEGGWDDYYAEIAFFEEFPEGPRKEATFQTEFANGVTWQEASTGHPYYHKTRGFESAKTNSLNPYVIRYADAYLLFAEADNKANNGPSTAAFDAVNAIRRRAAGLDIDAPAPDVDLSDLDADAFHRAVIAERGWEFAGEWERWWDLVRNEMVAEATSKRRFDDELPLNNSVDVDAEASFQPFYLAPIPQNELLLRPDWEQNPCCR